MLDIQRLARERVESLERESSALTGDDKGFLLFARENCSIVGFLSFLWSVWVHELKAGGAPTKLFIEECDLLLNIARLPQAYLRDLLNVWQQRALPKELADPVHAEVQSARDRLEALVRDVRTARERVAKPSAEVSADPEELKRRVQQADERQEWIPLRDAITQIRQSATSKQD